eukprot:1142426-Pelagomonas_calceolata.AAC.2
MSIAPVPVVEATACCVIGSCPINLLDFQGLVDVDLSGNGITSEGAIALAQGVAASQSLAAVLLDNNDIRWAFPVCFHGFISLDPPRLSDLLVQGGKEVFHARKNL